MLGLPEKTHIRKPLPKKVVFEKFKPKSEERRRFDKQISRMVIIAEIAPHTVNISAGEEVAAIFVIHILLKEKECHPQNIVLLSKLIDQRMLFLMQYEDKRKLAVYRKGKILMSEWLREPASVEIRGHNLDSVWESLIAWVGNLKVDEDLDLDAAIELQDRCEKLKKKIVALDNQVKRERQPRSKWDLSQELKRLKAELEETCYESR